MFRRVVGHLRRQPVAFVALFFALSGVAVAGTGYLTRSDKITKGDLAGSTYGNPLIAAGKVTDTKLANPSLTVTAGTGLSGGGSIALGGSGSLSVDPTAVQSRVSGTCSSGGAISSINQNGTVGCQSPVLPDAWTDVNGGPIGLAVAGSSNTVVASKLLPAGSYVIIAKTTLENTAGAARGVYCFINPGGKDTSNDTLAASGAGGANQSTALQATTTLANPGTVSLECIALSGSANDVNAQYGALTAIQVGTIH